MKRTAPLLLAAAVAVPALAQSNAPADAGIVENARVRSSVPVYAEVQVPRTECSKQAAVAAMVRATPGATLPVRVSVSPVDAQ